VANKLNAPNTVDEKFEEVVQSAQAGAVLVPVYSLHCRVRTQGAQRGFSFAAIMFFCGWSAKCAKWKVGDLWNSSLR
jgi:hypothetical protein